VLAIITETGIVCFAWLLIPYHAISKGVDAGRRRPGAVAWRVGGDQRASIDLSIDA